jgi:DNA-binding MarR family transcriptional regulator
VPRHPTLELVEVVHQRVRLGILAVTVEAGQVDFGYLKQRLELTDGNLSRHLQVLEGADLVKVVKGYEGKRPRTWVKATAAGREALDAELNALRELLTTFDTPERGPGTR